MNCSMLNFSLAFRHSIKTNAFVHLKSRMPMTTKTFASAADLEIKQVSFDKLSEHAYAYTAEGDPNTGIIIGDDARSEEHTSELQSQSNLVCRLLLEKKKKTK